MGRSLALVFSIVLAAPPTLRGQDASAPPDSGFVEEPFDVTSSGLLLPGTLTRPTETSGPIPIAVIVVGSGPTDRNGNGPLVQTDMYAQLAHGLARRGVASVRYDKRGIGPSMFTVDHTALTLDDFVGDVMTVAGAVAADSQYSSVYLVGHSEGAGLVLQAANRGAPVAGIAMLSGLGRPLQDVIHDQFLLLTDSLTVQKIDEAFERFLEGEDVADAPEVARPLLAPVYRRLIASMAAYDPEAEIARATVPVLIVQGAMDLQVLEEDAERLHAAQPAAEMILLPNANHVLKAASTREPAAQMATYQDRSIPIVSEVVDGIADWIDATEETAVP